MRSCDIWVGGKLQVVKQVASYLMELELTYYNFQELEYSFYEEVNIVKGFMCNFLSMILDV
jgi:hypothetical protein